jgi:hypothetical protein
MDSGEFRDFGADDAIAVNAVIFNNFIAIPTGHRSSPIHYYWIEKFTAASMNDKNSATIEYRARKPAIMTARNSVSWLPDVQDRNRKTIATCRLDTDSKIKCTNAEIVTAARCRALYRHENMYALLCLPRLVWTSFVRVSSHPCCCSHTTRQMIPHMLLYGHREKPRCATATAFAALHYWNWLIFDDLIC